MKLRKPDNVESDFLRVSISFSQNKTLECKKWQKIKDPPTSGSPNPRIPYIVSHKNTTKHPKYPSLSQPAKTSVFDTKTTRLGARRVVFVHWVNIRLKQALATSRPRARRVVLALWDNFKWNASVCHESSSSPTSRLDGHDPSWDKTSRLGSLAV